MISKREMKLRASIPDAFTDAEILELAYALAYFIEAFAGRDLHIKKYLFLRLSYDLNHKIGKDPMSDFSKIPIRKHNFVIFLGLLIKTIVKMRVKIKKAQKEKARRARLDREK